jgi:hypothetical protein
LKKAVYESINLSFSLLSYTFLALLSEYANVENPADPYAELNLALSSISFILFVIF